MNELLTPADIELLAQRAGIPMAEVLRRAGVAPSIFSRWKSGKTEPNLDNYRRIRDAAQGKPVASPPPPTPKRRRRPTPAAESTPAPAPAPAAPSRDEAA